MMEHWIAKEKEHYGYIRHQRPLCTDIQYLIPLYNAIENFVVKMELSFHEYFLELRELKVSFFSLRCSVKLTVDACELWFGV